MVIMMVLPMSYGSLMRAYAKKFFVGLVSIPLQQVRYVGSTTGPSYNNEVRHSIYRRVFNSPLSRSVPGVKSADFNVSATVRVTIS